MFLTLPFLTCLFWTAAYALDWRKASPSRRVLTVFMGVCAMLYVCHAIYFRGCVGDICSLSNVVYCFCNLSVFPIYYLYIRRLTNIETLHIRGMAVLLPAAVLTAWKAALYLVNAHAAAFVAQEITGRAVFFVELCLVVWFGMARLRRFDREIDNMYSNRDHRSASPAKWIMLLLVITAAISIVANFLGRGYFSNHPDMLAIPSVVFSILLFFIGYAGTKETFSIDDIVKDESKAGEYEEEKSEPAEALDALKQERYAELQRVMDSEKLYLMSDLRLVDVAKKLRISRTALSAIINQCAGVSFSDYINSKRVEHACHLMVDKGREYSLQHIGEESGFSSDSSFYRAFRKFKGMTPKLWQSQQNISEIQ